MSCTKVDPYNSVGNPYWECNSKITPSTRSNQNKVSLYSMIRNSLFQNPIIEINTWNNPNTLHMCHHKCATILEHRILLAGVFTSCKFGRGNNNKTALTSLGVAPLVMLVPTFYKCSLVQGGGQVFQAIHFHAFFHFDI